MSRALSRVSNNLFSARPNRATVFLAAASLYISSSLGEILFIFTAIIELSVR